MIGVTPGEAAFDAGMAAIGLAVLVRHHAHDLVAAHLRLERAADAAIGASRHHRMFRRADLDHSLLVQRRGRAGLHAGAARNAFGAEERLFHARRDHRAEAAAGDGQREGALHLLAGAHAARTDDALARFVGEIRIGLVEFGIGMLGAVIAVAHFAQAHGAGHVLQFAIAVGRAGQAVERMVGDVKLHHALAQPLEPVGLRAHHHAVGDRRRARGRRARPALDLDQTQPARAEGVEHVGRAELRDLGAELHRRAHDRGAFRHRDRRAVDGQRDGFLRPRAGRPIVDLGNEGHHGLLIRRLAGAAARRNLRGNG